MLSAGKPVTLVIPKEEAKPYRALLCDRGRGSVGGLVKIAKCPVDDNIGAVRHWIMRRLFKTERILMLDDDLEFYHRPDMHMPYLLPVGVMDIRKLLLYVDIQLTADCPMVGISARKGNADVSTSIVYNTAPCKATALDLSVLREANIRGKRMAAYEDVDLALRVLSSGRTNSVLYNYCWESKTRRRCTTPVDKKRAAKQLAANHPRFVKLVKGEPQIDWSKVYENRNP